MWGWRALVEGLATPTVVTDSSAADTFDVRPVDFDEALRRAVAEMLGPMTASPARWRVGVSDRRNQSVGPRPGGQPSVAPKTRCAVKVVICRPGRSCEGGDMRRDYESLDQRGRSKDLADVTRPLEVL